MIELEKAQTVEALAAAAASLAEAAEKLLSCGHASPSESIAGSARIVATLAYETAEELQRQEHGS